VLALK